MRACERVVLHPVAMRWVVRSAVVAAARWRLEHREILEQRNHADDDHDRADDLSGAGVERQHVDEIEDQNDNKEGDDHANEDVHARYLSIKPLR